jgi:D-3-phosphoglycerate dehydrogenase
MTRAWLRRYGFPECEIVFGDDKATIARNCGCNYAVEDSVRHASAYADAGVTCFLLMTPTTPAVDDHPHIRRVNSLMSIVFQLEDIVTAERQRLELAGHALSGRPKIVIADAIHPAARSHLAQCAELIDVDGTDRAALLDVIGDAEALIVRSETMVTQEVLAAAHRLRVVARAGVGVDNVDLDAATRSGVLVLNAPGANRISAGEHTIALLLALTRRIPHANESTHGGRWERKLIAPIDLAGRTAGIVGLGRVGSVVAKRLKAFEMNLIGYDPYIVDARFEELGVTPVDYETLLREADVVTFHVPSNAETHHMLDAERIGLLKRGAIVINAARGEVVDEHALADALREGRIWGAGVDVFPHEPCAASPLFGLPNVVLTPHTGGSSAEALAAVGGMISTTTLAALAGQAVPNAVNLPPASLLAPDLQRLTSVAGAAGHLLSVLQPERPWVFSVTVRGLVPGDVTEHVLSAGLCAALERWTGRRVTPVNARLIAKEIGIQVRMLTGTDDPKAEPSFSFEATGETSHHVRVSWDRKHAAIVEVDRFALDRALVGEVLITHHRDVPGVIGRVGTILGLHGVNIAGMQVGRHHQGGEALMVVNVDNEIPESALKELQAIPGLQTAYRVSLPPAPAKVAGAAAAVGAGAFE